MSKKMLAKNDRVNPPLLELIHSDVGIVNIDSVGGSRYYVTFTDDFSRYTVIYFLKKKSEVFGKFKEYVATMENLTEKKVKGLRSDNGGEYVSDEFNQFCINRGIRRELTIPMSPQQNGVAERLNRTLMESTRSMLHHAKLPLRFWAKALNTAVYLRNRSPTVALSGLTPYECMYGKKPDVSNLKVFGCKAFVHVPKERRTKLEEKSTCCVFVGYPAASKGFKFYDAGKKRMICSRDVKLLEDDFQLEQLKNEITGNEEDLFHLPDTHSEKDNDYLRFEGRVDVQIQEDNIPNAVKEEDEPPRRSTRKRNVPERLGTLTGDWWTNEDLECSTATFDGMEPTNIHEALNGKHAPQWKKAIESEYKSLIKNETWELVDLPADKNLVGCKWVFKTKRNSDGSISRYKARLVAQGYSQEAGIDYDALYAPVARYNSIRTVLAIANALDFEIHQMDVKTAFLNGKLEQEIFMKQPDGCIDKRYPEKVCKLQRSLYGLKQFARCWNQEIDGYLKLSGYQGIF
eukprot:gene14530-biopygen11634